MAAAELVPVTDKDLKSEASILDLYQRWFSAYITSLDGLVQKPSRFATFKENARRINEFNKREDESYKRGLNQFSDLTEAEFESGPYTGALLPEDNGGGNVSLSSSGMADDDEEPAGAGNCKVPATWDWRRHGAVLQ